MKKRAILISLTFHGAVLALAMSLLPIEGVALGRGVELGEVSVAREYQASPAQDVQPRPELLEKPPAESAQASPVFVAGEIPIETPRPEPAEPDPVAFEPAVRDDSPRSTARPPLLKVPGKPQSTAQMAAGEVASAPHAAAARPSVAGVVETPPRLVEWEAPRNVSKRFKGKVVAVIRIDAQGHATQVELEDGTGNSGLDEALCDALKEARYRPATEDGRPVAARLRQPIIFE